MRIVALYFAHFPLQVELAADPAMLEKPVIIGGYPHERKKVFDASSQAYAYGVKTGMSLCQAHALCPQAVFLPLNQQRYQQKFETLLDLIGDFIPNLEATPLGEIFLEIPHECWEEDLIVQIRQEVGRQTGFSMGIGSAQNKFMAQIGSRIARTNEVISIPSGRERTFLKGLSVDLLPISESISRRLDMLGIYKIGQLANLPRHEVSLQFGVEGAKLWQLSQGIDSSRIIRRKTPTVLTEQFEFDPPAKTFNDLLSRAQIMMTRLSVQLDELWQHCQRMQVKLLFAENILEITIDFKLATSSSDDMLRHLKHRLENTRLSGPVSRIEITVENLCAEQSTQLKLLDNLPRYNENLMKTIRQLQSKYGKSIIKRPVHSKSFSRLPEGTYTLMDFT